MKPPPAKPTKQPPPKPPEGWENARLSEVDSIRREHRAWLDWLAESAEPPLHIDSHSPWEHLRAAIVLLSAQVRHWREKARQLDTPENRKRARREMAVKIAKAIHVNPHDVLKAVGATSPELRAHLKLVWYDWLKAWHDSSELRAAVGYSSESQFRLAIGQIVRTGGVVDINGSPEIRKHAGKTGRFYRGLPWMMTRPGRSTLYAQPIAVELLAHRLRNIKRVEREKLVGAILKWREGETRPEMTWLRARLNNLAL
jgi:hypothetical protein